MVDRTLERMALWRADPACLLTESDIWTIVPANPPVSLVTLTGGELRKLFEENLEATSACDPWQQRGGYVKRCRGIELTIKLENPQRHRIQEFRVGGERLRDEAAYRVGVLGGQAMPLTMARTDGRLA